MTEHDHGLSDKDLATVRHNWELAEQIADRVMEAFRESRDASCGPWCVPQELETLLLRLGQFELVALVHVLVTRLINREEIDRALDTPTPP